MDYSSLKKELQKYKTIFDKSSDLTTIIDVRGFVCEFNEASNKKYGYVKQDLPLDYRKIIYHDDIEKLRQLFGKIYMAGVNLTKNLDLQRIENDEQYRRESIAQFDSLGINQETARIFNKDRNKVFEVEFDLSLLIDYDSLAIDGFLLTYEDVTERNLYRKKMEESEDKYRALFKFMPIFSMLVDFSGKAVELNYESIEEYGVDQENKTITYRNFVYKDDHEKAENLFIALYKNAGEIKKLWKNGTISREECFKRIRKLEIRDEPLRLTNKDGTRLFDGEFSARIWIGEKDLEIKGALITSKDVSERNLYRHKLEDSEKKYRELVENKTRDIIFSLDRNGCFSTINKNITEKLGYLEDNLRGKHISSILFDDTLDKNKINTTTFLQNLERVMSIGAKDVRINAVCKHKFLGEPVTLQFKIDPFYENDEIVGILGFATELSDDPLRDYLNEERICFEIENKLTLADEICFKLTRNLKKFFSQQKINLIRIGLREIIFNAIEHGNLGLSFNEKTKAKEADTYQELLRKRQNMRKNRGKKVYIEYTLNEKSVTYIVRDEGNGFDYKKLMKNISPQANNIMLQHGRGLIIVKSIFNKMTFNKTGNEVRLYLKIK